jgi:hypothetical protein
MATLVDLLRACGESIPPGTKSKLYFTLKGELAAWPQTKEELGGSAQGDSKILDEPFDFSGAPSGLGFWRAVDILVNTGQFRDTLEGEIGGQGFTSRVDFFVLGQGENQLEFADCVAANNGCLIAMVPDKSGNHRVLGNLDDPAFVEAIEGGTGLAPGDRVGAAYTLYANMGITAPIYDADTHGIDTTPNP